MPIPIPESIWDLEYEEKKRAFMENHFDENGICKEGFGHCSTGVFPATHAEYLKEWGKRNEKKN